MAQSSSIQGLRKLGHCSSNSHLLLSHTPDGINSLALSSWTMHRLRQNYQVENSNLSEEFSQQVFKQWVQQHVGKAPMVSATYSKWKWSFSELLRAKLDEKAALSLLISRHKFRLWPQNVKEKIKFKGTMTLNYDRLKCMFVCLCDRDGEKAVFTVPGMVQEKEDFCHFHQK